MPTKIICDGCGSVLHNTMELIPLDEVLKEIGEECPNCGRRLASTPINVTSNGKTVNFAEIKPSIPKRQEKWWRKNEST